MSIRVVEWIPYEQGEGREENCLSGMGGFFNMNTKGQRWKDFAEQFIETAREYPEALRAEVVEKRIRRGGFWHQGNDDVTDCGCPVFSDGTVSRMSFRAWGDFMAAVWSEEEDKDYCYVDFAWNDPEEEKANA